MTKEEPGQLEFLKSMSYHGFQKFDAQFLLSEIGQEIEVGATD